MKVMYRPCAELLSEAMENQKEFNSLKELFEYLVKESKETWDKEAFGVQDIFISYYGYDRRIDWETYVVTVGKYLNENYIKRYGRPMAIGYLAFKD